MAEIRITISEIVDLCIANELIPDSVSNIEILSELIKFRFKSEHPVPINIDLEIYYKEYHNGLLFLEIQTNWIVDKVLRYKKIPNIKYFQYEHPTLTFLLQQFLNDKLKIVQIEDIHFKNGYFKIKTFND